MIGLAVFCMAGVGTGFGDDPDSFDQALDSMKEKLEAMPSPAPAEGAPDVRAGANEDRGPAQITEVTLRGNKIVSTNTILSKLRSQKGEILAQDTINEDIKRLYGTGFFEDIKIEVEEKPEGFGLVLTVREKPIIRRLRLEGFTEFKESKLRKEMKVIEGQILDRKDIKQGIEAIRRLYADKGFRFVDIESEVDVDQETREASILIRISEGSKYGIKKISFEGNKAFDANHLKKYMKTKERNILLLRKGVFKESNFQKDLERLRFFYQQEGFLDVKIQPEFDYDKGQKEIRIRILVEEGTHYVTGEVSIKGNQLFPETEIWQELEMLPGLTYSQHYLAQDVDKIRQYYHERGYINARIIPDVKLNRDSGKVDVFYQIEEGDLYFVDKVVIRGNTKTKDVVIRRELRIRPGERFDGEKIQKSKQRLENLGFFDEITYDTEPSQTSPNRKDLIFRVREKRTGELSFGGGVSSIDRFVGFAEISQRNFDLLNFPRFTGGGQSLSLKARVGTIHKDFSLNFVEPYLFNKPISFGTDLFNVRRDYDSSDYNEERMGFTFTVSRLFRDVFQLGTGYTLERVNMDDLSSDAPQSVREFEGKNWLSRMKIFGSYDKRDNIWNPRKGMLLTGSAEMIGGVLAGDQDFYIIQGGYTQYWTFKDRHTLEYRLRAGTASEFGGSDTVPVFDRFFAGGLGSVRGYNYRRVGPIEAGNPVGGETLVVTSLDYNITIPNLEQFRGVLFVDAGHVNQDAYNVDAGKFAVSVGPGIKVKTPIGPLALYYGFPIANKDTEDSNGRLEFSLSRGF